MQPQQTLTKLDKRQTAQYIRVLMECAGLNWEDLRESQTQKKQMQGDDIPDAWKKARGILKNHPIDPLAYQEQIRSEWENYP